MSESRVEIIDQGSFQPREWLRRDVLWASLMAPYAKQMAGWNKGTQKAQHDGNVSRQELYASYEDDEAQSLSFFHQGKNVAGLITSAAVFKAFYLGFGAGESVDIMKIQAENVDRALNRGVVMLTKPSSWPSSEDEAYEKCTSYSSMIKEPDQSSFGVKQRLLRASIIMSRLATCEAAAWIDRSMQDDAGSLPTLEIHDGGYPRSPGGDFVERLMPAFQSALESPQYKAYMSSTPTERQ